MTKHKEAAVGYSCSFQAFYEKKEEGNHFYDFPLLFHLP